MEKRTIKSIYGNFDIELIERKGVKYVATISETTCSKYLTLKQVPRAVVRFIKKRYKIKLFDATQLNFILGLI